MPVRKRNKTLKLMTLKLDLQDRQLVARLVSRQRINFTELMRRALRQYAQQEQGKDQGQIA